MCKNLSKSLRFQDTQIHYYQEAHGRSDGFYSRPSKFSDQTDLQTTWDLVIVERGVVLRNVLEIIWKLVRTESWSSCHHFCTCVGHDKRRIILAADHNVKKVRKVPHFVSQSLSVSLSEDSSDTTFCAMS